MEAATAAIARIGDSAYAARMMTDDEEYERQALELQDRIATMSDEEVRQAYLASDGEPGDPWIDLLASALEERNIDV